MPASLKQVSLRTRLLISYIALITLSIGILGVGYYYKSSDVVLKNASQTYLGMVKNGNQSLEDKLSSVEKIAVNMHMDEDLYRFFNDKSLHNQGVSYQDDRSISHILQKYFPMNEDLFSVNLVTKPYIYGDNPYFWIPKTNLANSTIYSAGLRSTDYTSWIPTYNLLQRYYESTRHAEENAQYVFSAVRLINLCTSTDYLLHCLDDRAERPVLLVNFQESMLKRAFAESLTVPGSYYYVLTTDDEVVSRSDQAGPLPSEASDKSWISQALREGSGTEVIAIGGKKMVVVFDKIETTGWLSALFIPYDRLLGTVPNMVSFTLYSTCAAIALSIFFASLMSGRILLPVKRLMVGIRQLGEGNFGRKIEETGTGELSALIYRFNQMNDKIQLLIDENYQVKIKEMEAELKALNFQFNPHFLYNTLNTLNYLAIEKEQPEISHFLVELSEMLTYTARGPGTVPFASDYRYLQNYVSIMKLRFQDRFDVQFEVDPKLMVYNVPKFFLQPFVENALIHGLEERESGGFVRVVGHIRDDRRVFVIADNGKGMTPEALAALTGERDAEGRESIGIENVDKRIKLMYGKEYGVRIESAPGRGTQVRIELPTEDKSRS